MKKNKNLSLGIILILIAASLSSVGQLLWKFGADTMGVLAIILYLLGFVAAGAGMLVMMLAFRYGEVSILQPMMSTGFALSIFLGAIFLGESITLFKIIGTGFIIAGSVLLALEDKGGK